MIPEPPVKYWLDSERKLHRLDGPAVVYDYGLQIWFAHGVIHRDGGPAVIYPDGTKKWMVNGILHRLDGPAIDHVNRFQQWLVNGRLHRLDGPAIIYPDGTGEWWKDGERHRNLEDGPAVVHDGYQQWWFEGKFIRGVTPKGVQNWLKNGYPHREDGPAIIYPDGTEQFWLNGQKVDPF